MGRKRYNLNQAYRGRQEKSLFLKVLVIVLAVLLALGVAFLGFVTHRYLRYTDDGPKLDLPWLHEQPEASDTPNVSDLIITDAPEPSPSPSPTPEPVFQPIRCLEVSASAVTGGTAGGLAARAGADALVIPVQDEEGNLAWQPRLELAQEDMNGDPGFREAAERLARESRFHLTARLSGFRDLWTSVYDKELAIVYPSGRLWYDTGGISWISPSNETARAYLTDLCLELAEMGFDEILLEHAGYPESGRVAEIAVNENYPAEGREEAVSAFLEELSGKLSEAGAELSVLTPGGEPDDGAVSGVTPAALSGVSGQIWLPEGTDPAVWENALARAGMPESGSRLVAAEPLPEGAVWTGSILLA